jgi:hypothetical protein
MLLALTEFRIDGATRDLRRNHEEGDDDNGYGQVYEKRGFSGGGAWNKGGLGTPKSQMSGTSRRR